MTNTTLSCNGINHRDQARMQTCKDCGRRVARTDKGKLHDVRMYTTEGGYERTVYACYSPQHQCKPEDVTTWQAAMKVSLDRGDMIPGQRVVVARGRKYPKGTTGQITWTGDSDFGPRARVQPDSGEAFFIALANLDVAS